MSNTRCTILGHRMVCNGDITRSYCSRKNCNYTEILEWDVPPMPPVKTIMDTNSILKKSKYYMSMVYLTAMQSEDPSTQIGCIIVGPDKEIRSTGYNGLPRGVTASEKRLSRPEKYKWIEHAERNALYNAVRMGISVKDCYMYVNAFPCEDCARAIIQSGIKYIIVHDKFTKLTDTRWNKSISNVKEMFNESDVKVIIYDKDIYTNLVGKYNYQLVNLN